MNIKPLGNRVVVLPNTQEHTTSSGLIVIETKDEKTKKGVVVAKGNEATQVEVGDTIIYPQGVGVELDIESTMYFLMRESDIIAVCN